MRREDMDVGVGGWSLRVPGSYVFMLSFAGLNFLELGKVRAR